MRDEGKTHLLPIQRLASGATYFKDKLCSGHSKPEVPTPRHLDPIDPLDLARVACYPADNETITILLKYVVGCCCSSLVVVSRPQRQLYTYTPEHAGYLVGNLIAAFPENTSTCEWLLSMTSLGRDFLPLGSIRSGRGQELRLSLRSTQKE
jgi:hypothetical protein